MNYKVLISNEARNMLALHIKFLANVSKDAARTKKEKIINAIKSLSIMPRRFPFFNDLYMPLNKYRKLAIDDYYVILFQICEDTVFVDYILDARQNHNFK